MTILWLCDNPLSRQIARGSSFWAKLSIHETIWNSEGWCNITYPSETHLKLKSHENWFVQKSLYQLPNRFVTLHRVRQWYLRALCNIAKLFVKWGISNGRARFREIWVSVSVRYHIILQYSPEIDNINETEHVQTLCDDILNTHRNAIQTLSGLTRFMNIKILSWRGWKFWMAATCVIYRCICIHI